MYNIPRRLFLILLLCVPLFLAAQTHDFGGLVCLGFEQKIVKNFDFNLEAEGRFNHCLTSFDRMKLGASFDYSFLKKKRLKVSVGANYLLYNEEGVADHRGRVFGALTYTEKFHQFKLGFRLRAQSTFYDDLRGYHKFNPKTYLRGRVQLDYNFPNKPMSLFVSTEFFWRLYQKGNCIVDNFRTMAGWDYKLSKGNRIGVFVRADNEIQVKNPENIYYLGVSYSFRH